MSDSQPALARRVLQLREAFDRGFALPAAEPGELKQELLILGVGADRYAVKLEAVLGVDHGRKIVPLPSRAPGLLGLAGLRGELTPVFSLASLLGCGAESDSPPWLIVCRSQPRMALAFDRFEGSVRVAREDVSTAEPEEGSQPLTRQTARLGPSVLYVIDVPSTVAAARKRVEKG